MPAARRRIGPALGKARQTGRLRAAPARGREMCGRELHQRRGGYEDRALARQGLEGLPQAAALEERRENAGIAFEKFGIGEAQGASQAAEDLEVGKRLPEG